MYPQKPVSTDLPILDAIRARWSPVSFSSEPVEEEKIATLFEAARWAPSCFNEQPWRYIYAAKAEEGRAALESLLLTNNQWAKDAGILLIGFARKTFAYNGKENRHFMYDVGTATGYLALQLPSLGLIGHQMAGFDYERAASILHVPEGYVPTSMMAIGYPGPSTGLAEDLQKKQNKERTRKPQQDFVFRGQWKERPPAAE